MDPGVVISQSIAMGTEVEIGTVVDLTLKKRITDTH